MEGFFAAKQSNTGFGTNCEEMDLTLKLSPCGENAEEKRVKRSSLKESVVGNGGEEEGLVRFGDLQTMRRVRTGKRLLLEKLRRAAAAEADKSLAVSRQPLAYSIHEDQLNTLPNPPWDSRHQGGASFNIQTSTKQENYSMLSSKAMQEMALLPFDSKLESPAKRLKYVYPNSTSDAMDILRKMTCVTTTGDGPTGKRIEGFLYKYKKDQVCIVCVCHGHFLSPEEFVMHVGGKEVADPMKHIIVCSDSFYIGGDGAGFITHPFYNV